MVRDSREGFRPRVELLEGRELPNSFYSPLNNLAANLLTKKYEDDLLAALASGDADKNNPGVAPVQSNPYGSSYGEWSARWWQYALSVDAEHSPFFDYTGANFDVGQSGKVWYLSGVIVFTSPGQPLPSGQVNTVVRNVSLPSGTSLFVPVLNVEEDNLNPGGTNFNYSADQLRTFAHEAMASAENMQMQVDGKQVQDLMHYDVTSPVFSYTLPKDNIDTVLTGANVPSQTVTPVVGEGVYVMLRPLPVGQHTIHFAGDFGPGNFALDVTYHITVTPGH